MKGRFFRIFELFNQRNTRYYQKAFDKLEKKNKTTFNFAAAFGSSAWLVFRKMYGWAALFILVYCGIQEVLLALCKGPITQNISLIVLYFISIIVLGFFGNTLYYKDVKSKIAKGYAEMDRYNLIDPIGGIGLSGIVYWLCAIFLGIFELMGVISQSIGNLLITAIGVVFVAIPWAINYRKFRSQESVELVEVAGESVNRYLEKADPKHLTWPMIGVLFVITPLTVIFIFMLLFILIGVYIVITNNKATRQQRSDKVAEEIVKTPNNSEISKTAAELPAE